MRSPRPRTRTALLPGSALILVAALILPGLAAAASSPPVRDEGRIVVVRDGGEEVTLRFENDGRRLVVRGEDGRETAVVDLSEIGDLVAAALEEAGEALADLPEIRLDLEEEGVLRLREDGREVRIDIDRIMEDVSASLERAFEEFDRQDRREARRQVRRAERESRWEAERALREETHPRERERHTGDLQREIARLQREVGRLQSEMADLQQEISRLRQRQQH